MQKKSFISVITAGLTLLVSQTMHGQSSYFTAVTNLNPVGYWPLNETTPPPQPLSLTAKNLGNLGAAGNGYYGAWYQASGNTWFLTNDISQIAGVTSDGDVAMNCPFKPGQYVILPRNTNGVANSAITINAPFTIETWVKSTQTNGQLGAIVSEGEVQLNANGPNTNDPFYGGPSSTTVWAGFALGQYANFYFFSCFNTNAYNTKASELDSPKNIVLNQWIHLVCTFDGTYENMYENGVLVAGPKKITANAKGLTYVPDPTSPLMIGAGSDPTVNYGVAFQGAMDEVAIYHSVLPLTSIVNHYQTAGGTNATYGANYTNAVLADNPMIYFRLDDAESATNAGYASGTFPVATNYGSTSVAGNGVYQPGTTPGVAGPSYSGFGSNSLAVAINGWLGAVDVGSGNLPAALNPTGIVPMSLVSWFQSGPADAPGRFQEIVGHSDNSYRLALGQVAGENHFNPGPGPELQFTTAAAVATNGFAFNDGNWHMVAGVTDGTNEYMYLDGILAQYASNAAGINIKGTNLDLLLGGDPEYTYASVNVYNTLRTFDGQIAHVSIFSNALSAAQIQGLFNAAGVPPSIVSQPLGKTNNQGANLTVSVGVRGSQPISYQWYSTNGTAVNGQTNQNLVYTSVPASASGSYYLVGTSPYGSVTSSVATVLIYGSPEVMSQSQPSLQVYAGVNPVLFVSASGAPPILYQWYSNGVVITSATNSSYAVVNAQATATYTCTLTNFVGGGLVTGSPITLNVVPDPTAPYPATILAASPLAFWRLDESSGVTAYDYIGGNNATYTNVAFDITTAYHPNTDPTEGGAPGFGINTTNNSYAGWVPTNVNFATPTNVNGEFSVECWLQQYLVYGDDGVLALGYGNGGEEFALDTGGNDPAHDLRFYVRDAGGAAHNASTTFAPTSDGAWHHVVGVCDEANGHVYLYIDGTNAGSATIPSNGGVLASSQSIAIGSRQEALGSQYDNQFIGAIDEVAVYNYALTPAQVQAHYLSSGIAPVINQIAPASQTVNSGSSATFTATVTGTAPLSYQWLDPNNNLLSTNLTLVISNAQQNSQGNYTFQVTGPYGTVSATAYLSVNIGPPGLVQDVSPLSQTVVLYSGLDTLTYSVVVSGTAPFFYQWYLNGAAISGATSSSYTFTALPGTNSYYVTITNVNSAGTPLQSSTATVIGVAAPQLNLTNYAYRVKISFPGYTGQPLTNFPALITLNPSTIPGFNYGQLQPGGTDLRFTDSTGTSMLAYEIDEWNDNGLSTIWVQIPVLNGSNIWAYFGNPADYDVPPASSNVWSEAGYEIVYHLKEGAFPYEDSTGNYPATNGVAPTQTTGVVGHAGLFNGVSDYITPGAVTLSNQFTTYAWVNIPTNAGNILTVWANQKGGYGNNGFSWFVDSYNTSDRIIHNDSGNGAGAGADDLSGTSVSSGQWHFMTAVWDLVAGKTTNYLDAVANGSGAAVSSLALTNQLDLGAFLDPIFEFNGAIDEARIQNGVASTNWIATTYLNISSSSFVGYSSVNLEPMLSIISATNGYILAWTTNDGVFTLETTTDLSRTNGWTAVVNPPAVVTNGVWEQVVQPAAGSHFYRLQGQ